MATRPSKKILHATLKSEFGVSEPEKTTMFEAYGRDVRGYVSVPAGMTRREFERKLTQLGFSCNPNWNRKSETGTEVKVSYFKAWHWDE